MKKCAFLRHFLFFSFIVQERKVKPVDWNLVAQDLLTLNYACSSHRVKKKEEIESSAEKLEDIQRGASRMFDLRQYLIIWRNKYG